MLPPLKRRYRNMGAPRNEVMAPMGRITGEMTVRATRSPPSMSTAPMNAEPGMSHV